MKKLFLWVLLMGMSFFCMDMSALRAQDVLRESFEAETWPPVGWSLSSDFGQGAWEQIAEEALPSANAPTDFPDGTHAATIDYASLAFVTLNLTTPVFDLSEIDNPELSFQWYHAGTPADQSRLEVYVSYVADSFQLLETIPTNVNTEGWVSYRRILNRGVRQIRLRGIKDKAPCRNAIYMDDFVLKNSDACPFPQDLGYRLLPDGNGEVLLMWTVANDENHWEVKVSAEPTDNLASPGVVAEQTVKGEPSCRVTGLEVYGNYRFSVRTICGSAYSEWIESTFRVDPAPLQVPFECDFELDSVFTLAQEDQPNIWRRGTAPYDDADNHCFYISVDDKDWWHYGNADKTFSHMYRDIVFPEQAPYGFECSFDFKGMGASPNDVMEVWLSESQTYYPQAGAYVDYNIAKPIAQRVSGKEDWTLFRMELPASYAGKTVRLIVSWKNTNYGTVVNPPAAFDNLAIRILECPKPKNLHVTDETLDAITIVWDTTGSKASEWYLEYGPYGFAAGSGQKLTVTEWPPFTLNGLESCSRYDFSLKAGCADSMVSDIMISDTSDRLSAATLCRPVTAPYYTDFDDTEVGQYPLGWSYIVKNNNYTPYILEHDFYAHSKPNCLMMNTGTGDGVGVVSPELEGLSDKVKRIRFYARIAGPVRLEVGVLKSPDNPDSFVKIKDIQGSDYPEYGELGDTRSGMFRHTVNLDQAFLTEEYRYVCIRCAENGVVMQPASIDDFVYERIPSCLEPVGLVPFNIGVYSFSVTWTAAASESQWEAVCLPGGYGDEPEEGASGVVVTERVASFSNLEPGAFYRVYVRALCSETEKGGWSDAFLLKTCQYGELPFMENFDGFNVFDLPLCWSVRDYESMWTIAAREPYSRPAALYYPAGEFAVNDWLFTPEFPLKANETYRVTFRARKLADREAVLRIYAGETTDTADMIPLEVENPNPAMTYGLVRAFFTPKEAGYYHIGVHYESPASPGLLIDDFGFMKGSPVAVEALQDDRKDAYSLYPNPASGEIFIYIGEDGEATVTVYDIAGAKIRTYPAYRSGTAIPTAGLRKGLYFFRVSGKDAEQILKAVIR